MAEIRRKQLEFVIRPDGTVTERVHGVPGAACERLTYLIELSLGRVAAREHTGEYYQQEGGVHGTVHTGDQ